MAKCRICKKILDYSQDDFIRLKQKFYYHTECYRDRELNNQMPTEVIDSVIDEAKQQYTKDQDKKIKKYKGKNIRNGIDNFTDWIQEAYDIEFLPKAFFTKLSSVANGTYKGLKEPVSYVELLDMLQRRKKQLDLKLASKKFNSGLYRFYYDLAVVLAQYDSYKKWKIVQEIKKEEAIESVKAQQRQNESNNIANKSIKQDDSLEDVLDEIFG